MKNLSKHKCQEAIDALLTQIEKEAFSGEDLEALCRKFPSCDEELRSTYRLCQTMETMPAPEPSANMHAGFYKMLNEFNAEEADSKKSAMPAIGWWTWNGLSLKWAALAAVFLLGLFSGALLWPEQSESPLAQLEKITSGEENDPYATLTSSASVTERLQGVQMIKQMDELDNRIIEALNQTLLHDDNVNVRLSAIETMLHFSENPRVREKLIRAIPYQTSPLIQMTLAEIMIALKDDRAVEEIKRLLQTQQVELEVKMKMEETIETLL